MLSVVAKEDVRKRRDCYGITTIHYNKVENGQ